VTHIDSLGIAVVIPTRDRRDLLSRALQSVRAQTCKPAEIIVVDDGSTDGTAAMVRARFPEVVLLQQAAAGVSAARNRGITHSRSEWIALLDSDDEWTPTKLERQCETLARRAGVLVCHTDEIWIRRGRRVNAKKKHAKPDGQVFESCLPLCCISPSSILLHRSVLADVGMFDESLPVCEDYDLWLRIASRYPVALVDEALVVKHGGHDDQLSRRHWGIDRFRIRALEGILASGVLSAGQRRATLAALEDKVRIYESGARKRGKLREAREYDAKLKRSPTPADVGPS
jgi:glycosyltransferase involved in cell wall biosynthesis